jgi:hypothetical protein
VDGVVAAGRAAGRWACAAVGAVALLAGLAPGAGLAAGGGVVRRAAVGLDEWAAQPGPHCVRVVVTRWADTFDWRADLWPTPGQDAGWWLRYESAVNWRRDWGVPVDALPSGGVARLAVDERGALLAWERGVGMRLSPGDAGACDAAAAASHRVLLAHLGS